MVLRALRCDGGGVVRLTSAFPPAVLREAVVLLACRRAPAAGFSVPRVGPPLFRPTRLAGAASCPLNAAGVGVANTVGRPWFTDANCARFVLADRRSCDCAAVGPARRSCAAANSAAVGRALVPPLPPL